MLMGIFRHMKCTYVVLRTEGLNWLFYWYLWVHIWFHRLGIYGFIFDFIGCNRHWFMFNFKGRLQFWLVGCLSLIMENEVEGSQCCRNRTLKMFDDQMRALQNSIRTIVNDDCCCCNNSKPYFNIYFLFKIWKMIDEMYRRLYSEFKFIRIQT